MLTSRAAGFGRRARLALGLFILLLTVSGPALAQTEGEVSVARRFYEEGLAAEKDSRWEDALAAYDKALAIRNTPQLALRAGICHEELGRLAKALVIYERAHEQARLKQMEDVRSVVAGRLEALRPRVPYLVIRPKSQPEGLEVKLDDSPVAPATFGVRLPVDPGEHLVTASAPDHEPFEKRVTLEEGAEDEVRLTLKATPGAGATKPKAPAEGVPTGAPDTADEEATYLPAGLLLGGGAALLGGAAVLLIVAMGNEGDVDDRCGGAERLTCPLADKDDIEATLDDASTFRVAGFVVGGVGAAAVITGLVLAIAPPTSAAESAQLRFSPVAGTPLSLGLAGSF